MLGSSINKFILDEELHMNNSATVVFTQKIEFYTNAAYRPNKGSYEIIFKLFNILVKLCCIIQ